MADVSAALVKELREKTGAGMMDCKKALSETGGDLEAAVDWLRAKGLSKAAKKADRAAAEGLVAIALSSARGDRAAMIELNSETDFVARNETFQQACAAIARIALDAHGDVHAILASRAPDGDGTVQDMITRLIATIGENMTLRRAAYLSVDEGIVASYVHGQAGEGMGKIGVLVALKSSGDKAKLEEIGRKVAQHIAATAPAALTEAEVPADRVERERAIILEQVKADPKLEGKPEKVIDGAVQGKLRKIFEEIVLLKQKFVHNPDLTVEAAVKAAEKDVGAPVTIAAFSHFKLGEGVEKPKDDFAAEVAATAAGRA